MKNSRTLLFILFSLVPHLVSRAQVNPAPLGQADSMVLAHQQAQGPGLAIAVMHNGEQIFTRHQGYANLEHRVPITDSTRFLVGSISKQFTSYAVLLLEADGKLSIDDPIQKYLPELALPHSITLRQLANHTNGLRNSFDLNSLRGKSDEDLTEHAEMVNLLLRQQGCNFAPGERFQYHNAGFVLLAEIVTRVSGMPFSAFVAERIFEPLQMDNSVFFDAPFAVLPNQANSYRLTSEGYQYIPMNRSVVGSTGLYTTTGDLLKWAENLLIPTVGSAALVQKMQTPSTLNSGETIPYGLGQETKMYRGRRVVFHGGGDAGYRAYLVQVPEYNFSVVITGNYEAFNPLDLAYGMIDIFLEDQIEAPESPEFPHYTTESLKPFEGSYQVFPGLIVNIIAENDTLYFQPYGTESMLELPVLAENVFAFPYLPHSRVVFSQDQMRWHLSDFSYPGPKITVTPPKPEEVTLSDYSGTYYNDELQTYYTVMEREGRLVATHPDHRDIPMTVIAKDTFYSDAFFFGKVEFVRDGAGTVTGLSANSQVAYDVLFTKTK